MWVRIPLRRDVFDTTLYDKVCQWLATGRWCSQGTPVSSTNTTDRHDIAEILLKMALKTIASPKTECHTYTSRTGTDHHIAWSEFTSVLYGVPVTQSLVLCVVCYRSLFAFLSLFVWPLWKLFCKFSSHHDIAEILLKLVLCTHLSINQSFGHCIVCHSSIYGTAKPCEAPEFTSVLCGVHITQSLVLCVVSYRCLFTFWSFFFWPLYCLSKS